MWMNTQASICKDETNNNHGGRNPLLSGSLKYTPSGTNYYYEFEYYIDDKRYVGKFTSRATIREMKLYFNDTSSPSTINVEYNSENPSKYKIPLLKKYRRNSIIKGLLSFVLLVLGVYGLIMLISLFLNK